MECHYCDGRGEQVLEGTIDDDTGDWVRQRCWYCEGSGTV